MAAVGESWEWLRRKIRQIYTVEKRRIRLCFPRPTQEEVKTRKKREDYQSRREKLAQRYLVICLVTFVLSCLIYSVFVWRFVNPLHVLEGVLSTTFIFLIAVVAIIGLEGVFKTSFHLLAGTKIGTASIKSRNFIYLITLAYFFLDSTGARSDAINLIPVNALRNPEDLDRIIFFFLCVTWLSFVVSRLFDAQEASRGKIGNFDDAFPHLVSYFLTVIIGTTINNIVPLILTIALVESLSIEPVPELLEMACVIVTKVDQANIIFVRDFLLDLESGVAVPSQLGRKTWVVHC